jgi:hypothetical protein
VTIHFDFRNEEEKKGVTGPARLVRLRLANAVLGPNPFAEPGMKIQAAFYDGNESFLGALALDPDQWLALRGLLKAGFEEVKIGQPINLLIENEAEIISRIAKLRNG